MTGMVRYLLAAALFALLVGPAGCCSATNSDAKRAVRTDIAGLCVPFFDSDVSAMCDPPIGWKAQALKSTPNHNDQVWLSPTGDTAYGVIHFKMPLPVGENLAFIGFLRQMKKIQGQATLLARWDDPGLPGIRFIAEGGLYVIRTNLLVAGWDGWAVYAGTLKTGPILPKELDFAVRAREHTRVGRLQVPGS